MIKRHGRGFRLAIAGSAIALLVVTLPVGAASREEDPRDDQQRTSRHQHLNRSLNERTGTSAKNGVEGQAKDEVEANSSTHEGSPRTAPAALRGRLERLDYTNIGLELGSPDDNRESGVINRVLICHKPGSPAEHTLLVPEDAVPGHLGHGDFLGTCDGNETEAGP